MTNGLLGFALLLMTLTACENDLSTVRKLSSRDEAQVETGNGVTTLYSTGANVRAKLTAPELKHYNTKDAYAECDKGLAVDFYNDSLQLISTLTARYGRMNEKDNTMLVRDSVVVVNQKHETLRTEELIWNSRTHRITSDKFVQIQTADELIYGDGLDANEDLTDYKIRKIRGTLKVKEGQLPQ